MRTAVPVFTPAPPGWLRGAAARLLAASAAALGAMARALQVPAAAPPRGDPVVEFHAEAGAPEGALYVDGVLVGLLPGVTRL